MAKMHSRKKGASGSKRPLEAKGAPKWMEYKPEEVVKLVLKYRAQDQLAARIGAILRDQYGIPSVFDITGKSITQILKDNKQSYELPEDLRNVLKRAVKIAEHMTANRKDYHSKRGLFLTESKVRRLADYYKSRGILPETWEYTRDRAKLLIQ